MAYCTDGVDFKPKRNVSAYPMAGAVKYNPEHDEDILRSLRYLRKLLEMPNGLTRKQSEDWLKKQCEMDIEFDNAFLAKKRITYEEQLRILISVEEQRIEKAKKRTVKIKQNKKEMQMEMLNGD